ncbi:D-2-hydroxyacid dehydrogenase [Fredinandcohnia sp. QZ13]|uniref:D-2-hydroxyacid dehydrogenase n=1 Tax=Fredinandcohnia sp. QZ13 TaxID=3073144 RepID=UPI00285360F1|nr:D-2-hydroxyacid dehydrogenase [Fredinandcohnia sp. QZ13]MDR4887555.1 D-2-hydroxyacid dehydrogenase [Fredinandcohnia sp. QZ13]
MRILSTFIPIEEVTENMNKAFPDEEFIYCEDIEKALPELHNADILLTYGEDLTPEHIEMANNLKWIMVISAGLELMPFQAIKEKGILVTNVRGIHKIPMAEYTLSMMLHVTKKNMIIVEQQKSKSWDRLTHFPVGELHGKTIGILGVGAIGGEIARLAKAFNMKTIGVNRSGNKHEYIDEMVQFDKLNYICEKADYLVSVLPSTNETKYILNDTHFDRMKKESVFINIGRGDLVKDEVILRAIQSNKIAHAVLDVFEQEPLPSDHPFWTLENVTVTPHISSKSKFYQPRSFEIFEKNLHIFKQGGSEFINKIDLNRGY